MGNETAWQEAAINGRFAGKTVFVTGAGSGIGQATALRVAKEGGRVIAADISKERLDALVEANSGLDLVPVARDISTEETAAAVVVAAGGRVDALATITNIEAVWGSQLAAERLGPLMQATVPTPATASQLAASITFLLSDDGTNVNGAILASDGGWSAL
ncbi:SDR family NAD(P)-dependent oxidoreductase [Arthrobacter sp. 2RAF6]|uniref:SDR family NAD(P)-dependent oxidoreductase n=1 Tax=Arthrobacter sp. 2RAF6 TaxID=3233002 RepID=UPI003F93D425